MSTTETPIRPPRSTDRSRTRRSSLHFDRLTSRWHLGSPSSSFSVEQDSSSGTGHGVKPLNVRKKAGQGRRASGARRALGGGGSEGLAKVVKQLVVEAEPGIDTGEGLKVQTYLKISVPLSSLADPEHSTSLPLFSDHSLRILSSEVVSLPSLSTASPTVRKAADLLGVPIPPAHGRPPTKLNGKTRAASISSVVSGALYDPNPAGSVSVRNFAVCLVLEPRKGRLGEEGAAEYVVVLDAAVDWATRGPDWPFAVCLPTPPCLRNSLRLRVPFEPGLGGLGPAFVARPQLRERPSDARSARSDSSYSQISFQVHTGPADGTPQTKSATTLASTGTSATPTGLKAPRRSNRLPRRPARKDSKDAKGEERPLSDESEPEMEMGSALESDVESFPEDKDGEGEERSVESGTKDKKRKAELVEGVFQSTENLWILFAPALCQPPPSTSAPPTPVLKITKTDTTTESFISHTHTKPGTTPLVSLDVLCSVELCGIKSCSLGERVGVRFRRWFGGGGKVISERWEAATGQGVVDTSLPSSQRATAGEHPPGSRGSTNSLLDLPTPYDGSDLLPSSLIRPPLSSASTTSEADLLSVPAPFTCSVLPSRESEQDISFESPLAMVGPSPQDGPFPRVIGVSEEGVDVGVKEGKVVVWFESTFLLECAAANPDGVDVNFRLRAHFDLLIPLADRRPIPLPMLDFGSTEGQEAASQTVTMKVSGEVEGEVQVPEAWKSRRVAKGLGAVDAVKVKLPPEFSSTTTTEGPVVRLADSTAGRGEAEEAMSRPSGKSRSPLPDALFDDTKADDRSLADSGSEAPTFVGTIISASVDATVDLWRGFVYASIRLELPRLPSPATLQMRWPVVDGEKKSAQCSITNLFVGGQETDPPTVTNIEASDLAANGPEPSWSQPSIRLPAAEATSLVVFNMQAPLVELIGTSWEAHTFQPPVFSCPVARTDWTFSGLSGGEHADVWPAHRLSPTTFRSLNAPAGERVRITVYGRRRAAVTALDEPRQRPGQPDSTIIVCICVALLSVLALVTWSVWISLRESRLTVPTPALARLDLPLDPDGQEPLPISSLDSIINPSATQAVTTEGGTVQLRPPDDFLALLLAPVRSVVAECVGILDRLKRLMYGSRGRSVALDAAL